MRHPFLAVCLLGLALPGQRAATGPELDSKLLEAAQRHRQRGEEPEALALARAVLERQPDHQQARMFLGQQFFAGRWRLPEEVAYLRRAAGAKDGITQPPLAEQHVAEPPAARAPEPPVRAAPALDPQPHPARPPRCCAPAAYGLFDLRLQWVRSLGFETVPVSFGNGSGRLQLPRTESVSFGGAAVVPLGR